MREIEVKILEIDVVEIRKKLLDMGAEKIFDGEVHAIAFDFPDERLHKDGGFVRVRRVGDKVEFCYKGKKEDSEFKTREEIEVNTSGFKDTIKILEKIGLAQYHEAIKNRESYKIGNVRFEIDSWENIPHFLEIEAPTEEQVKEYVERLGFTMKQTNNWGYLAIEKYYQNEQKNNTA